AEEALSRDEQARSFLFFQNRIQLREPTRAAVPRLRARTLRTVSPPLRRSHTRELTPAAVPTRLARTLRTSDANTRDRGAYGRASPAPSARGLALVTRLALR